MNPFVSGTPAIRLLIAAGVIVLITLLVRWLLYRFIPPLLARQSPLWDVILPKHRVLHYLYLSVPGMLVASLVQFMSDIDPTLATLIYKASLIYSIILLTLALIAAINAYSDFYNQYYDFAKEVPIKTVIQAGAVLVVLFSILIIIAIILDVPVLALAGVVAIFITVAYYMFREPLLGFSASLQLSMNHMLALGDWIEMSNFGADGQVEDINLTSTKVRNWDNAIVTIPTSALINNPFQNWRSMQSRDARQMLRPIYIDQETITFTSAEQKRQMLGKVTQLYENLPAEAKENEGMQGVTPHDLQDRDQLTNLELFMAYATQIIAGHPQTRVDYSIYIRQQTPSPQGLPVETFFFTRSTDFVPYHAVQREIFSHLLAVLPDFDLRPYQLMEQAAGGR